MKLFAGARRREPAQSDVGTWRQQSDSVSVLVIDDDEDDAMLLRANLDAVAGANYNVTWASTYAEGLSAVQNNDYDVCLVDYQLGGMDGVQLVREARAAGYDKPMVMLTGQRDRSVDLAAMDAGANDFLVKGRTDPALLERTLRYAVSLGDAMEALRRSNAQLAALDEIGSVLSENGPTPEALDRVLGLVVRAFRHTHASIYLLDGDRLVLAAQRGYHRANTELDPNTARLARVLQSGKPSFIPNHTSSADDRGAYEPSELSVAMHAEGRPVGILNVAADSRLGEEDHRGIIAIADRIAVALALNRALGSRPVLTADRAIRGGHAL